MYVKGKSFGSRSYNVNAVTKWNELPKILKEGPNSAVKRYI